MKIATWNIERLKHKNRVSEMVSLLSDLSPDILVVTEADDGFKPSYPYYISTKPAIEANQSLYKDSERRVTIYSMYEIIFTYPTYDSYTAICPVLNTPYGELAVYGTIMGIYGNREKSYLPDVKSQIKDICTISSTSDILVAGDFNLSFSDGYYTRRDAKDLLNTTFKDISATVLTYDIPECIDHIVLSDSYYNGKYTTTTFNESKTLSDHMGVMVDLVGL